MVLMAVAACSDPTGSTTDAQVPITWMEWPAAVTASQPGSIRITGFHGFCGVFHLAVVQSGASTISVNATEHFDSPTQQFCPAAITIFDTILPLPHLGGAGGTAFVVDAPAADPIGVVARRPFGFLELSSNQPDATLHVGGRAYVLPDSLGCSWARAQMPLAAPAHVLSSNVAFATNTWHPAFVSGVFMPALSPRCGQNPLLQLGVLQVDGGY